ncbi:MAG: hypothetical protein SGPRY_007040 [Prymnesium sp.]
MLTLTSSSFTFLHCRHSAVYKPLPFVCSDAGAPRETLAPLERALLIRKQGGRLSTIPFASRRLALRKWATLALLPIPHASVTERFHHSLAVAIYQALLKWHRVSRGAGGGGAALLTFLRFSRGLEAIRCWARLHAVKWLGMRTAERFSLRRRLKKWGYAARGRRRVMVVGAHAGRRWAVERLAIAMGRWKGEAEKVAQLSGPAELFAKARAGEGGGGEGVEGTPSTPLPATPATPRKHSFGGGGTPFSPLLLSVHTWRSRLPRAHFSLIDLSRYANHNSLRVALHRWRRSSHRFLLSHARAADTQGKSLLTAWLRLVLTTGGARASLQARLILPDLRDQLMDRGRVELIVQLMLCIFPHLLIPPSTHAASSLCRGLMSQSFIPHGGVALCEAFFLKGRPPMAHALAEASGEAPGDAAELLRGFQTLWRHARARIRIGEIAFSVAHSLVIQRLLAVLHCWRVKAEVASGVTLTRERRVAQHFIYMIGLLRRSLGAWEMHCQRMLVKEATMAMSRSNSNHLAIRRAWNRWQTHGYVRCCQAHQSNGLSPLLTCATLP